MKFKAVENYLGYKFAVIDENGDIAECGHETFEEAKKAAKNFTKWN